jgi:hypothetical protein
MVLLHRLQDWQEGLFQGRRQHPKMGKRNVAPGRHPLRQSRIAKTQFLIWLKRNCFFINIKVRPSSFKRGTEIKKIFWRTLIFAKIYTNYSFLFISNNCYLCTVIFLNTTLLL